MRTMLLDNAAEDELWYHEARWLHGVWSKILKFSSILLIGFGTLCPLINNLIAYPIDISVGYLSLSVGGIILLFDKYFSLSSGFQRFYMAEMEIIKLTKAFIIDWESEAIKVNHFQNASHLAPLMKIAKTFDADISKVIITETKNWSVEFAMHMEELRKSAKGSR